MLTSKKILLIDDDEDDREFFTSLLDTAAPQWSCVTAENGLIAMEILNDRLHLPDIIFLDLNMPVMNGHQFLKMIKSSGSFLSQIPIIVLSTSFDRKTMEETKSLGAFAFITKPNKLSVLEEKIKEVLNKLRPGHE